MEKRTKIYIGIAVVIILVLIGVVVAVLLNTQTEKNKSTADTRVNINGTCGGTGGLLCNTGLTCTENKCLKKCTSGTQCKSGQICQSGACVSSNSQGQSCSTSVTCPTGQICQSGICTEQKCTTDSSCIGNINGSYCKNGSCIACVSDNNCAIGKICNIDGVCVTSSTTDVTPKMMRLLTTHGFTGNDIRTEVGKTTQQCIDICKNESQCKAFTRPSDIEDDNIQGECYLKSGPIDGMNKIYSNTEASNDNRSHNAWVKINQQDGFTPRTGPTDNTYIKSTNNYINGYDIVDVSGTLQGCISQCNSKPDCRGFNRQQNAADNQTSTCQLKYTNVVNSLNPTGSNDAKYNSWVNISVPEQIISGHNTGCRCDLFCGQDWNTEFPYSWGGARCAGTITSEGSVSDKCDVSGYEQKCICMRDDKIGFLQRENRDCSNTKNTTRFAINGSSKDEAGDNKTYNNYYKKANNITDRILKIKTNEPRSGGLDGSVNKDALCSDWCNPNGFNYYNTGQNEFSRKLGWDRVDNQCLYTKSNFEGGTHNCDENVNRGEGVSKQCVCLKRV